MPGSAQYYRALHLPRILILALFLFIPRLTFAAPGVDTVTVPLKRFGFGYVTGMRSSPDGLTFVTASSIGYVRLWGAATGKVLTVFSGFKSLVYTAAFTPDGSGVLLGMKGRVELLDINGAKKKNPHQ